MSDFNKEIVKRIRDMTNCADASYALLDCVFDSVDSVFPSKVCN